LGDTPTTIAVDHYSSSVSLPNNNGRIRGTDRLATQSSSKAQTFNIRIAAVRPDFTATPTRLSTLFYSSQMGTRPNELIRTDLKLLNASPVTALSWSSGLYGYLTSIHAPQQGLALGQNLFILRQANVSQGGLFYQDGNRNYDAVILGFTEYVTASEYQYYKNFVATGGVLIELDAPISWLRSDTIRPHNTSHSSAHNSCESARVSNRENGFA